jgi:hypothetical protein
VETTYLLDPQAPDYACQGFRIPADLAEVFALRQDGVFQMIDGYYLSKEVPELDRTVPSGGARVQCDACSDSVYTSIWRVDHYYHGREHGTVLISGRQCYGKWVKQ